MQVEEQLKTMGISVERSPDCLTCTKIDPPFTNTIVFRLKGVSVINDRFDLVAPYFQCTKIIVEIPHRKDAANVQNGTVSEVCEIISGRLK